MALKLYEAAFSAGEIGRVTSGRVDLDRYQIAARRIENFEVTPVGSVRRGPGTAFVASAKFDELDVRLERFEFSIGQAYALEIGELYIRFYRNRARIEDVGVPVEVSPPYMAAEVSDLQMVQQADVLFLVHESHPPARLIRIDDLNWRYEPLPLAPAPILEVAFEPALAITPSALAGTVTLLSAGNFWLEGDIGRTIKSGTTEVQIIEVVPLPLPASPRFPSIQVIVETVSPFASLLPIAAGDWTLSPTPGLDVRASFDGGRTRGSVVTLHIESDELPDIIFAAVPGQNNLVDSGDFITLAPWDDQSGRVITEGNFNGGNPPQVELVDDTKDFVREGVEPGHRALNTTQNNEGLVGIIRSIPQNTNANSVIDLIPQLAPSPDSEWDNGDAYEIRETGSITHDATAEEVQIRGGKIGRGAVAQQTGANGLDTRFLLQVDVRKQPVIVQVASVSPAKFGTAGADVVPESTLEVGTQRLIFKATALTNHYLQFSNTQDIDTVVDNVILHPMRRSGWRLTDVGRFVKVGGGVVEITTFQDEFRVVGIVRAALTDEPNDDDDIFVQAGLWQVGDAAWSATNGYPRAVSIHQQRLFLGGTTEQPLTLWGSAVGDFFNFNTGPEDADALELTISSNQLNAIQWMESLADLLVGTVGGEHLIRGGPAGLTPASAFQVPQTTFGSSGIRPIRYDNVLYMLARGGESALEITTDIDTGLLSGRNLIRINPEIMTPRIKQWMLQRWPYDVIWAIREDGDRIGLTLDLSENVRAFHQHKAPGDYISGCVVPADDAVTTRIEDIYFAVKRLTATGLHTFIELVEDEIRTGDEVRLPLTMYGSTRFGDPSGPVTITQVTGLSEHLEGRQVGLMARQDYIRPDGRTGERWTWLGSTGVNGGIAELPEAVAAVDVGIFLFSTLELLRPTLDLRDGNLQFRRQRIQRVNVRTIDTVGFLNVNEQDLVVRTPEDQMDTGFEPEDRDLQTRALETGFDEDGFVVIESRIPFPCHIISAGMEMQAEEME